MEISDSTSTASIDQTINLPPAVPVVSNFPKGLASVPDSIEMMPTAPKPYFVWRVAISFFLIAFQLITWPIRLFHWTVQWFFGNRQKELYLELYDIAKNGDGGQIREFLVEHSEEPGPAGYLFSEFLDLPELYDHLPEILQGANICLEGDHGDFCRRWSEHPDAYQRISSHNYQGGECFALDYILFWVDLDGNTRFQFENSPWGGFFNSIHHAIDFLRYQRDNEQQGVAGSSLYTEDYCIHVRLIK